MHCLDPSELRKFFQDHGLRCTRQREHIYAALASNTAHPTAEEIYRTVRSDQPGLSLATVYNTLDTFVDQGLCRKIPSSAGNGPSRYDADIEPHAHILLDDGTIMDVPRDLGNKIDSTINTLSAEELEQRLNIAITGVQIQIHARPSEAERFFHLPDR